MSQFTLEDKVYGIPLEKFQSFHGACMELDLTPEQVLHFFEPMLDKYEKVIGVVEKKMNLTQRRQQMGQFTLEDKVYGMPLGKFQSFHEACMELDLTPEQVLHFFEPMLDKYEKAIRANNKYRNPLTDLQKTVVEAANEPNT